MSIVRKRNQMAVEGMSTLFDSIDLAGLRKAHLVQLFSYLLQRDVDGWYIGPRAQFEQRHHELKAWLKAAVDHAYSEGVVMPGDRK